MKNSFLALLIGFIILSCTSICTIPKTDIDVSEKQVSFGPSTFPCKKVNEYESAVKIAILSIYSDEFEIRLTEYMKDSIGKGEHAKAWEGLTAKEIVKKMQNQINGEFIETYGGICGWLKNKFAGNLAYDGTMNGPIKINRIPLNYKWRDASSIANTIAHETAHRIGLTHPHSKTNLKTAYKEPPYVIGNIIENIAKNKMIDSTIEK